MAKLRNWILWFLVLILSAVIIPFTLLSNVQKFYGSFLFWVIFAIIAILSIGIITAKWRD